MPSIPVHGLPSHNHPHQRRRRGFQMLPTLNDLQTGQIFCANFRTTRHSRSTEVGLRRSHLTAQINRALKRAEVAPSISKALAAELTGSLVSASHKVAFRSAKVHHLVRLGKSTSGGIPLILTTHSRAIEGLPLARVDKLSVVMAYARGVFGALAVAGFIGTFMMCMMWLTGNGYHLDDRKTIIAICVGSCFGIGTAAGLCTYLFPFQMTKREKDIRRLCGTILGISADPARVRLDFAKSIHHRLSATTVVDELPKLAHELACTRVRIALGEPRLPLEDHTDDVLEQIRIMESSSAYSDENRVAAPQPADRSSSLPGHR